MALCVALLTLTLVAVCVSLYLEYPCARVLIWVSKNGKMDERKRFCDSIPLYSDADHTEVVPPHSCVKLHTSSFVKLQIPKGFIGVAQAVTSIAPFKMRPLILVAGYHKNIEFVLENTSSKEQELPAYLHFGEIFLRKYAKILPRIIKTE